MRWYVSALAEARTRTVEGLYKRELLPWMLLGMTCGLVEGATVAVLVKKGYAGLVAPLWVNLAVAFVSGAPALANLSSFAWANMAHGRPRIGVLVGLQALFALAVGMIAFAPLAEGGLLLTLGAVLLARTLWAGVLTVRASVWSSNYPRYRMARMTARLVLATSLGIAAVALAAGIVMDTHPAWARWLYVLALFTGLAAAWRYRAVRVRRQYQLLAAEAGEGRASSAFSLDMLREILRADPQFRRYMFWLGLYGSGNLMMNAQLVVLFSDRLAMGGLRQIVLLTVVPLLAMPLFMPAWARLFDGGHIIAYRARQCWALVAAMVLLTAAVALRQPWLLWPGSMLVGISLAGANLGWNLGHNDFATPGRAQHYMGVHVTLTGVRGLLAPAAGMACHEWIERQWPGHGYLAMALPLGLVTAGAFGFLSMRRVEERLASGV
jgi:hypothetical protein